MIKSKELSDPNSCLNKAREDELIFVITEHDVAAIHTIYEWAAKRVDLGKNKYSDPKIQEALAWAKEVERRQNARTAAHT